jgi:hypothetical protein
MQCFIEGRGDLFEEVHLMASAIPETVNYRLMKPRSDRLPALAALRTES